MRAKPLPALDWPGLEGRTADELRERDRYLRLFADTLISAVLNAVEKRDIDRIVALLGAAGARRATDADLSELYELVALYAPRLDGALDGAREIDALWAELNGTPEATEPRFRIVEDPELDRSPPLVVLAESGAERPRIEARIAAIQHRYALYQGVISQLEDYFASLDGRRLDDFLRMALDARR